MKTARTVRRAPRRIPGAFRAARAAVAAPAVHPAHPAGNTTCPCFRGKMKLARRAAAQPPQSAHPAFSWRGAGNRARMGHARNPARRRPPCRPVSVAERAACPAPSGRCGGRRCPLAARGTGKHPAPGRRDARPTGGGGHGPRRLAFAPRRFPNPPLPAHRVHTAQDIPCSISRCNAAFMCCATASPQNNPSPCARN